MLRNELQLKRVLGEPESRYNVGGEGEPEIWRWRCSCLALRISVDGFQWSPCEEHRPANWSEWVERR